MDRILLTGFEPFGGETENPSALIAREVQLPGADLQALILPVEFQRAAELAIARIEDFSPRWIIMLGQAAGRTAISLERFAVNLADSDQPDNAGLQPCGQAIAPHGPAAYFSSLPLREMVNAMHQVGVPANISNTAGTYVCNDLFYRVMAHTSARPGGAGFIHIPLLPSQVLERPLPSMEGGLMLRAINAALASCFQINK